jgi:hypothetical protein
VISTLQCTRNFGEPSTNIIDNATMRPRESAFNRGIGFSTSVVPRNRQHSKSQCFRRATCRFKPRIPQFCISATYFEMSLKIETDDGELGYTKTPNKRVTVTVNCEYNSGECKVYKQHTWQARLQGENTGYNRIDNKWRLIYYRNEKLWQNICRIKKRNRKMEE